jgi:hypothetical protein
MLLKWESSSRGPRSNGRRKKLSSEMLIGAGKCGGRRGKQIVYIKMRNVSVRIQQRFSKCG